MAQVDKVSYLPLLTWFIIFAFALYASIGFFVVPKAHALMRARRLYFSKLLRRFFKYIRQFKNNLQLIGRPTPSLFYRFGPLSFGLDFACIPFFHAKLQKKN